MTDEHRFEDHDFATVWTGYMDQVDDLLVAADRLLRWWNREGQVQGEEARLSTEVLVRLVELHGRATGRPVGLTSG